MVFAYQNISEAEIQGIELTGEYHLTSAFSLSGSYEYLDARDTVLDTRLQGRAKHILRAGLRYQGDSVTASLRSRHYFDFYGIDPAQRAIPAFETNYTVVDASLRYSINGNMGITLGIDNLFDKAVPDNWSSTGAIEDPAGRFGYVKFDVSLD